MEETLTLTGTEPALQADEAVDQPLDADLERRRIDLEQREKELGQNKEMVDAAVEFWTALYQNPTGTILSLVDDAKAKGLEVDLSSLAPPVSRSSRDEVDEYSSYEEDTTVPTPQPPASADVAKLNAKVASLERSLQGQATSQAEEAARATIDEMRKALPVANDITFEEVKSVARAKRTSDLEGTFKALVFDRQAEQERKRNRAAAAAATMATTSRIANPEADNTPRVKNAKAWNPIERFGKSWDDIATEAYNRVVSGL